MPASTISGLSSGEFVGMVADNPDEKISLKTFHCEIINDHDALADEEKNYKPVLVVKQVQPAIVQRNYEQIRQDVQQIVIAEMERLLNDPGLTHLIIKKHKVFVVLKILVYFCFVHSLIELRWLIYDL